MSTYNVSIGEREYNVQITDSSLMVNGEAINVDLVSLNGNGLHLFRHGNRNREFYLSPQAQGMVEVLSAGRRIIARVDPGYRRHHRRKQVDAGDVIAPMPGLVVDVQVSEGDTVEAGQVLVVQEAMKMQMQLRAPFAGRVARLPVGIGAQVEKGAMLVKVMPTSDQTEGTFPVQS